MRTILNHSTKNMISSAVKHMYNAKDVSLRLNLPKARANFVVRKKLRKPINSQKKFK